MLSKDKLILDTANLSESDNVGAFIRDSLGSLITSTAIGPIQALDVNVANSISTSSASDHAEDDAHVSGDIGSFALAVRNDVEGSLVDADGDYAPLQVDNLGRLRVFADLSVATSSEKAEDSVHVSGDIGSFSLAVRQDSLASSVDADGDYAAFKLNSRGALWSVPVGTVADDAADSENPVKVGSKARIGALTAISTTGDRADLLSDRYRRVYVNSGPNVAALNSTSSVTTTAAALLGAQLSGRRRYLIQNLGNRAIYVGKDATVTTVNGFRMAAGSNMDVELGEDVGLFAITDSGTQDVRILELA